MFKATFNITKIFKYLHTSEYLIMKTILQFTYRDYLINLWKIHKKIPQKFWARKTAPTRCLLFGSKDLEYDQQKNTK